MGWLTLLAALATGLVSLALGRDQNFDLLNYHYYLGYAFLHGRLDADVVPAGVQTYHAPFLHVLHYLGIAHLPPRVFGFALGALHGLNVPLLFALALVVLRPVAPARRPPLALLAALTGVIGPNAVSMIGTTFGDNLVTLPALAGLVLALAWDRESATLGRGWLVGAGVAAGLATGLKLTMGVFHLGLLLALLVLPRARGRRLAVAGWFLLGSAAGFLPTGGFWACWLFSRFGNPVFPFANGLFRSEYFSAANFGNELYATRTFADLLRPVVHTALGRPENLQEIPLRDLRMAVLLAVALAVAALRAGRRLRPGAAGGADGGGDGGDGREVALLVFWGASYLLWAAAFPYYRYFTLLELTAPLVTWVLLRRIVPERWLLPACMAVALLLAFTTRTGSWGRRPWEDTWLAMPIPPLGLQPASLVLLVGQPISYAIPSFRGDARFVHLTAVDRFGADAKWRERVAAAVAGHHGPFLLLSNFEFSRATAEARAAAVGLRVAGPCEPIQRPPLRLRLCPLERVAGPF